MFDIYNNLIDYKTLLPQLLGTRIMALYYVVVCIILYVTQFFFTVAKGVRKDLKVPTCPC